MGSVNMNEMLEPLIDIGIAGFQGFQESAHPDSRTWRGCGLETGIH